MKRVVVVGAGMGGLASAARLAAAGCDVEVVEALPFPGGKAGRVLLDGVRCDTGPSVLTLPDVIDDLFTSCGRPNPVQLRRVDPCFRYHWADGVALDVFVDAEDTLASVRSTLGSDAEAQLRAFLEDAARIWELVAPSFVYGPVPGWRTLWDMGARVFRFPEIGAHRSMDAGIRRFVREPHLVDLLRRYATYNGSDPRRAPGTLNCIAWVELGLGTYGVEGGMSALVDHLVGLVEALGGRVRTGCRVEGFGLRGARVESVRTDSGELPADAVVVNADVAHLARLLPRVPAPTLAPSTSGWTGIVAAPATGGPPHEVWFPARYDGEFEDLFDRGQAPAEPTVYTCAQDRAHGVGRWEGAEPLFVMANAPAGSGRQLDLGERALARLGLDRRDLRWERGPADLDATFPDTGGALYGAASNHPLAAFRRPGQRVREVPGLYLASGSAHPGGGVPLCLLSGRQAALALLEDP